MSDADEGGGRDDYGTVDFDAGGTETRRLSREGYILFLAGAGLAAAAGVPLTAALLAVIGALSLGPVYERWRG